jgi:hypothetical protein
MRVELIVSLLAILALSIAGFVFVVTTARADRRRRGTQLSFDLEHGDSTSSVAGRTAVR